MIEGRFESETNQLFFESCLITLSLQEIARLPVTERHQILAPFIAATAEDFLTDPELTEFSVLDGEDWENNEPN
ncbi:hypothetical protein [Phormidium nigroviride]